MRDHSHKHFGDPPVQQGHQNILLIQLGDIGDVVLSIPAFRAVREHFPQAKIIVAVREMLLIVTGSDIKILF